MCARSFFTFQTLGRHEFGESLRIDRLVCGVNANLLFQRISLHYRFRWFLDVAGNFGELFIRSARLGRHESGFKLWVDTNLLLMLISYFNASLCITGFVGSSTSLEILVSYLFGLRVWVGTNPDSLRIYRLMRFVQS